MNRAERRRQKKTARKNPAAAHGTPAMHQAIPSLKARLQQATSPQEVRQIINALVAQGLPSTAGEELEVYAAEYHDATAILHKGEDAEKVATLVDNAHNWADNMIDHSPERDRRACRAGCAFCCYLPVVLVSAAGGRTPGRLAAHALLARGTSCLAAAIGRALPAEHSVLPYVPNEDAAALCAFTKQSLYGLSCAPAQMSRVDIIAPRGL